MIVIKAFCAVVRACCSVFYLHLSSPALAVDVDFACCVFSVSGLHFRPAGAVAPGSADSVTTVELTVFSF